MKPLHLEEKQFYYDQHKELYTIDEETLYCEVIEATYDEEGVELTPRKLSEGTPTFEQYLEFMTPNADGDAHLASYRIPKVVTMRQARLALLQSGILSTVQAAITAGTDEAMKIEWEYATDIRRDWESLIALTTVMGLTSKQLDDLFILAGGL